MCMCGEAGDLTSVLRAFLIAWLETDFCKSGFGDMGLSVSNSVWGPLSGFYKAAFRREVGARGGVWRAVEEGKGLTLEKVM